MIQPIIFQNTDYILCSVFATEYLGLYSGTLEKIYVKKQIVSNIILILKNYYTQLLIKRLMIDSLNFKPHAEAYDSYE